MYMCKSLLVLVLGVRDLGGSFVELSVVGDLQKVPVKATVS
jgi:hypothetical protein